MVPSGETQFDGGGSEFGAGLGVGGVIDEVADLGLLIVAE